MKKWYQSKTLWYSILTGIAGVVTVLMGQHPDAGSLAIVNSIIVGVLRFITTTGITEE